MEHLIKKLFSLRMLVTILTLLFVYLPMYTYVRLFHKRRQCWLIAERPDEARDNGYVLFKWIREHHPEIKEVYAIDKKSQDYNNVKDLGETVQYGSLRHWFLYFSASICCASIWRICAPNDWCYFIMRDILPPKSKRVYLKHGIIKDSLPYLRKKRLKADIFVCGAYPEWEYINKTLGYENGEPKYLGLARFDRLIDTSLRPQILYMPTWRRWIKNDRQLPTTQYFQKIVSFLSSAELSLYLKESGTKLIFFLHPGIKHQKHLFEQCASDNICVLNNDDEDMQKLICSSKLLVTDYSSIYFDFAYQGKPVIYYQFDYEEYRKRHYPTGYFSYERDGFGPIVTIEGELIETLKTIADNGWKLQKKYADRAARFFPMRDTNNCLRHYEALCELEKFK